MKALLQRVIEARVTVQGETVGAIGSGLLVFLGVEAGDTEETVSRLARRLARYRVFSDDRGRMNRSLLDTTGELLLVPQFTLAADTRRGLRPGFSTAAPPAEAEVLYRAMVEALHHEGISPATGRFGDDMQVSLINDGPVTFLLEAD